MNLRSTTLKTIAVVAGGMLLTAGLGTSASAISFSKSTSGTVVTAGTGIPVVKTVGLTPPKKTLPGRPGPIVPVPPLN